MAHVMLVQKNFLFGFNSVVLIPVYGVKHEAEGTGGDSNRCEQGSW
jgi:hypothetical protein